MVHFLQQTLEFNAEIGPNEDEQTEYIGQRQRGTPHYDRDGLVRTFLEEFIIR